MSRRKLRKPAAPAKRGPGAATTRVVRVVEVEVRTVHQLARRVWARMRELGISLNELRDRMGLENPSRIYRTSRVSERAFLALDRALEHPDWDAPLPAVADPAATIAARLESMRRIFGQVAEIDLPKNTRHAKSAVPGGARRKATNQK